LWLRGINRHLLFWLFFRLLRNLIWEGEGSRSLDRGFGICCGFYPQRRWSSASKGTAYRGVELLIPRRDSAGRLCRRLESSKAFSQIIHIVLLLVRNLRRLSRLRCAERGSRLSRWSNWREFHHVSIICEVNNNGSLLLLLLWRLLECWLEEITL